MADSHLLLPSSTSTVPIIPHRSPNPFSTWRSRYATVVLPLVPVTPSSLSRSTDGNPWNACASTDAATPASATVTTGSGPAVTAAVATTAIAPRLTAWSTYLAPSVTVPPRATNTCPACTWRLSSVTPVTATAGTPASGTGGDNDLSKSGNSSIGGRPFPGVPRGQADRVAPYHGPGRNQRRPTRSMGERMGPRIDANEREAKAMEGRRAAVVGRHPAATRLPPLRADSRTTPACDSPPRPVVQRPRARSVGRPPSSAEPRVSP